MYESRGQAVQKLDNDFFEAYKRLDRLCSDIYGCRNGVSRYIDDLEHVSCRDRLAVPMVDASYKSLKHLRGVRNQIAHDPGQLQICEESDIRQIDEFYNCLMTGNDPLTVLRKCHEASASAKRKAPAAKPAAAPPVSNPHERTPHARHRGRFDVALLALIGAAAILAYFLLHLL